MPHALAINKPDSESLTRFDLWREFDLAELVPLIPIGATLAPESAVKEVGKVPGRKTPNGWVGMTGWTNRTMSEKGASLAQQWGAAVGLQCRKYVGLDLDIEDPMLADEVEKLAFETFGDAPVRFRAGSARRLLLYRGEGFRKRRLAFTAKGVTHAVELLATGQQFQCEGKHKSGAELKWRNNHPVMRRPEGLTEIRKEQIDSFFA